MDIKLEAMRQEQQRRQREAIQTTCSPCDPDEGCAECPGNAT